MRAELDNPLSLPLGTSLVGEYRIESVLGSGGFGVTYLARDLALDRRVTIKEYFPSDFALRDRSLAVRPKSTASEPDYRWGLDRFVEEAQTLARFEHPNINRVFRYFRAHDTAYMVLQYEEGVSLKAWLYDLGRAPSQAELDALLVPLMDALALIHDHEFLHRDIAPDNIIIRRDGSPVLIDFGSARGQMLQMSKTISALVKPGYSPLEQYALSGRQQGPWTDIYSLGATLYQAVGGERPADAPTRMVEDDVVPAAELGQGHYRQEFLEAVDWALCLRIEERPQSIAEWQRALLAERAVDRGSPVHVDTPAPIGDDGLRAVVSRPEPHVMRRMRGDLVRALTRVAEERSPAAPSASSVVTVMPPTRDTERSSDPNSEAPAHRPLPEPPSAAAPDVAPRAQPPAGRARALQLVGLAAAGAIALHFESTIKRFWREGAEFARPLHVTPAPRPAAVAANDPKTVTAVDPVPDGKPLSGEVVLQGHAGAVTGLAFSGDGQRLISTGGDGTLRVWDTRGEIMRTIESATGRPTAMAIEGARVAIGHEDGTVEVWDLEAVQRVDFFRRNQAPIWALTFAGDLQRIAAASHDWVVTLWDRRRGGAPDHQFQGHANAVQAVAYAPASGIIASAGADKTVRLWHAADRRELRVLRGHEEFVSSLAIAPSGGLIASGSHDRRIRVWSVGDGAQKRTLLAPGGRVTSLAFAPDEDVLVSGGDDGTARIWNWRRGRVLRTLGGHRGSVRHVAIARDGRSIATGGEDGTIRVWTLQPAMQTSASKTYRFSE